MFLRGERRRRQTRCTNYPSGYNVIRHEARPAVRGRSAPCAARFRRLRPGTGVVRLRIETDGHDLPRDFLLAVDDIQAMVILLLILGGAAGRAPSGPDAESRPTLPLPLDSIAIGSSEDGPTLVLDIGPATLAFAVPAEAARKLGQSLLTISAPSAGHAS